LATNQKEEQVEGSVVGRAAYVRDELEVRHGEHQGQQGLGAARETGRRGRECLKAVSASGGGPPEEAAEALSTAGG
jgi:hypothetical protein